jgi:hypothetical protein
MFLEWRKFSDVSKQIIKENLFAAAVCFRGFDRRKHLYGFSMNWNKICGCIEIEEVDSYTYNNTYIER